MANGSIILVSDDDYGCEQLRENTIMNKNIQGQGNKILKLVDFPRVSC